jgi:drug/metabolite transporter (DMT)-like permease
VSRLLTNGALALLILIWGTTWAAIRVGLEGLPPFTGIAIRFAIAALVLMLVAWWKSWPLGSGARTRWLWLTNAALSFSASYGLVYWAEQWVPSGLAAVLFSTFPLFVAVMAHLWLPGERLTPGAVVGIVAGFLGVLTIFSEDLPSLSGDQVRFASAVFLISPLVSAVASVVIKRYGEGLHPMSLTAVPMAMTAAIMGVLAAVVERGRGIDLDPASTAALLYLAICGTAVTFFLYFWLLDRLPATRLSLITYGVPIVAVTVGTLVLNEPFTMRMLIGGLLVLGGVLLAVRSGRARARS